MAELTRRNVLAATIATAAVGTLPLSSARAAAPAAGKQAPGFYRYKLGDIEVTVVNRER